MNENDNMIQLFEIAIQRQRNIIEAAESAIKGYKQAIKDIHATEEANLNHVEVVNG
jgi:hypothetical protein